MSEMRDKMLASLTNPIAKCLKKEKITTGYLVKKLKEELEATEEKFFAHEGMVISTGPLISWRTRQTARMDAHKLMGHYPAEKVDVNHQGNIIVKPLNLAEKKKKGGNGSKA